MNRKKILLVDDSATTLMMERFIFRNDPYDLVTAADGVDAIDKAVTHRPDLILLDVSMPRMGGIEACRRLRAQEETRSTPIIIVTNRGEAASVQNEWSCGCDDFVMKPINAVELLAKVRSLLAKGARA
jgi:DNA-binding response OmpR family regulator